VLTRARDANILLTMAFWRELETFGQQRIAQRLKAVESAEHANSEAMKHLVDLWRIEKRVIEDFLKLPYAAVEAAQKGDSYGR
jgi:hypothetical protein